jgi:hypothetical protein
MNLESNSKKNGGNERVVFYSNVLPQPLTLRYWVKTTTLSNHVTPVVYPLIAGHTAYSTDNMVA